MNMVFAELFQQLDNIYYWGNSVFEYGYSLFILLAVWLTLYIFKYSLLKKLISITENTENAIDDIAIRILDKMGWPILGLISLNISVLNLTLHPFLTNVLHYGLLILSIIYGVIAINEIIQFGSERIAKRRFEEDEDKTILTLLTKIAKGIVWFLAALFILQNFGVEVTSLMAGAGVGGIAIAIALQNVLGDLFASFSIYFDRPFEIGDFIIVGEDMGVVKHIGVKSTRIRALQGQEIVISNQELTDQRIHNYKKMEKRRIVFHFGVTYDTPADILKDISKWTEDIINRQELAETDRVNLQEFGDSSLTYEAVYYLDSSDYNEYMAVQEEINIALKKKLNEEGIEFAFPTRTIMMDEG